jgi:hypothetical protein
MNAGPQEFSQGADLFYGPEGRFGARQPLTYRRFDTLAAAVKFAIEELAPGRRSLTIQSGDFELKGEEIGSLYHSEAFPLARKG